MKRCILCNKILRKSEEKFCGYCVRSRSMEARARALIRKAREDKRINH